MAWSQVLSGNLMNLHLDRDIGSRVRHQDLVGGLCLDHQLFADF